MKKMTNKKSRWLPMLFAAAAVIMELYPKAVVVRRVATPEEIFRDYYSYFSMTPYWSENPYPLRAGICSCILLSLVVLRMWKGGRILDLMAILDGAAAVIMSAYAVRSQRGYTAGHGIGCVLCILLVISVVSIVVGMLLYDKKIRT